MWNKKSTTETIYNFFHGESVNNKLQNSLFGKFMNIISSFAQNDDTKEIINDLPLPKVIVIGTESSGKSSLLENILKCSIFPRNSIICTKQPIHLVLKTAKNEQEIYYKIIYKNKIDIIDKKENLIKKITDIMNIITVDEISDEEIHIEICDLNLPNFEFYDLPGIRAYPEKLASETLKLTEKYLQMPNTIVLCIVPATTPRITSYLPIALIKKYNKEKNTIVALTMADRVQQDNIYDLLVKRIINETDEYNQNDFAGCVAIINRSHSNSKSLEENDVFSNEWFYTNIIKEIPVDFPKENIELIKRNIGVQNLINNLDNLYNKFINDSWIPNTIVNLNDTKTNINNKKELLGEPIQEYDEEIQIIIFNLLIEATIENNKHLLGILLKDCKKNLITYDDHEGEHEKLYEFNDFMVELKFLCSSVLNGKYVKDGSIHDEYNDGDHMDEYNEGGQYDYYYRYTPEDNELKICVDGKEYGNIAIEKCILTDIYESDNNQYNLLRFEKLINKIKHSMHHIYNDKMNEYLEIKKDTFLLPFCNIINDLNLKKIYDIIISQKSMLNTIKNLVIKETINKIEYDIKFDIELLEEDKLTTELRDKYTSELFNIETTILQIESLKIN